MKNNGWILRKDRLPNKDTKCIVAWLNRYGNARWTWSLGYSFYDGEDWCASGGESFLAPDYWMPFPKAPEMTDKQKRESEKCYQSDRNKEMTRLKSELRKLEEMR